MFWYVVHVNHDKASKLVDYFNEQDATYAFIPKKERWFSIKGTKDYIVNDLYSDYVFVKSNENALSFQEMYRDIFDVKDEVAVLSNQEQGLFEKLFEDGDVVLHSVGDSVNGKFVAKSGPLKGIEDMVMKVDRHKRLATIKCSIFKDALVVAAEVVQKL